MSKETAADYAQYISSPDTGDVLSQLTVLADTLVITKAKHAEQMLAAEATAAEVKELEERKIPELMDSVNLTDIKTASGVKIKIAETIRASISQANSGGAFAWLRDHNHGALIKRNVSVAFGKNQEAPAAETIRTLESMGLDVEDKQAVHPSTLASFVREKLAAGDEIPLELFGVHRQRVAKITR